MARTTKKPAIEAVREMPHATEEMLREASEEEVRRLYEATPEEIEEREEPNE